MNRRLALQILRSSPWLFASVGGLLLVNLFLALYSSTYTRNQLEQLQTRWFEARKTAPGAAKDPAVVYTQGQADLKIWRERIIPKRDFARFLGDLIGTAGKHSLTFEGITYRPTDVKGENLVSYQLDFTVSGSYGGLKKFIADIGRMPQMLAINNIGLNTASPTSGVIGLKMQLTVYLKPEGT